MSGVVTVGRADDAPPSAAELMQRVYDSQAWIGQVDSIDLRARQTITSTEEAWQWDKEHPTPFFSAKPQPYDPRPFAIEEVHAWDRERIYEGRRSNREGDDADKARSYITLWDGRMAVEWGTTGSNPPDNFVLDNKSTLFFSGKQRSQKAMLPWGMGGAYPIWWWQDVPVDKFRRDDSLSPSDFEYVGREDLDGRPCHVIESKVSHYRLHIGVDDDRLYQRCWYVSSNAKKLVDTLAIAEQICGRKFKSMAHHGIWLQSRPRDERIRVHRELARAMHDFTALNMQQKYDDYREVAPGCWLPFHQVSDRFNTHAPKYFFSARNEYHVQQVTVNRPLDDALFAYKIPDGARISTDWRYDPPIDYTYHDGQTSTELDLIAAAKREKQAQGQAILEKAQTTLRERRGQTPPPLPTSGWVNGEPLTWEALRGKVVVLGFWDVNCGPCRNELPIWARWHDGSDGNLVFLGVHPPTDDVDKVRAVLAEFNAEFPTIVEAADDASTGHGPLHAWFGNTWWPNVVLIDTQGATAGFGSFMGFGAKKPTLGEQIRGLLYPDESEP